MFAVNITCALHGVPSPCRHKGYSAFPCLWSWQSNVANFDQCRQPVWGVSLTGGGFQEQVHDSPWSSSPATLAKEVTSSDGVAKQGGACISLDLGGISRRMSNLKSFLGPQWMLHEWEINLCCVPPWGLGMLVIPASCILPQLVGRVLGFSFNFQLKKYLNLAY